MNKKTRVSADDVAITVTNLSDTTQTETIVWHKYPDDTPIRDRKWYLIHHEISGVVESIYNPLSNTWGTWLNGEKYIEFDSLRVIAWTEMPKGYIEE